MSLRSATEIIAFYSTLKAARHDFESLWQEVADHVKGAREFQDINVTPGRERKAIIYDTTAVQSGDMLASGLHNFLTNTATKWFDIRPEDPSLLDDQDVREWFADTWQVLNSIFNRPETRFVPQMHQTYTDLVFWNTSDLFVEEVPGLPVRFSAVPLSEIYISEGKSGQIDTVVRCYKLTHRQAMQEFGKDTPGEIRERAGKNPEDKSDYLHLVHPNNDRAFSSMRTGGMAFRSAHVSVETKDIVRESGFREMPHLVSRWEVDTGEVYGRGPGTNALPDAKMLNEMSKTILKAAQKVTDPPLQVADDGVISPVNTSPGGLNVTRTSAFSTDLIKPLPIEPNLPIGVEILERRKAQVRSAFLHDFLQLSQDPRMTATQVIELTERAQALIAPILGRLQVEMLSPLITRVFHIARRAGMLPKPPPALQGTNIQVDYVSPVARAQMAGEVRSITNTMQLIVELANVDPSIVDKVDMDEVARQLIRNSGAPPSIERADEDVKVLRQARAQAAQKQQEQEELESAARAAPGLQALQGGRA